MVNAMNDFTKEELEILQWELNTAIHKLTMASLSCEKHSALNEKIQSMIDNYCEHEERRYSRKTGKPICPVCHNYFADNGDDIDKRLEGYCNE